MMKHYFVCSLYFLIQATAHTKDITPNGSMLESSIQLPKKFRNYYLVKECEVYLPNGLRLRSFPGRYCKFLDDGSFITYTDEAMTRINKDASVMWKIKGHFHHQINLSEDKNRILALSSGSLLSKSNFREDLLMVLSLEGKILYQTPVSAILEDKKLQKLDWDFWEKETKALLEIEKEVSHFNSFYEIPKITKKGLPKWVKEGNLIANGLVQGFFVLTPDLKKVLYHSKIKNSFLHSIHDVQINSEGNILYFNNVVKSLGKNHLYSGAYEIEPVTQKEIHSFNANPKQTFYSPVCGSIQELGDIWLISHYLLGAYYYNKKDQNLIMYAPSQNTTHTQHLSVAQQYKLINLQSFMNYWQNR
jgi:hypothetical protein